MVSFDWAGISCRFPNGCFPNATISYCPEVTDLPKLLIESEHIRLLHAGLTLVAASLAGNYCIVKGCGIICSIMRGCVNCKREMSDPKPQILGQLPSD